MIPKGLMYARRICPVINLISTYWCVCEGHLQSSLNKAVWTHHWRIPSVSQRFHASSSVHRVWSEWHWFFWSVWYLVRFICVRFKPHTSKWTEEQKSFLSEKHVGLKTSRKISFIHWSGIQRWKKLSKPRSSESRNPKMITQRTRSLMWSASDLYCLAKRSYW